MTDPNQINEVIQVASGEKPLMLAMDVDDLLKLFIVFLAANFLAGVLVYVSTK